jgi:hypothetical protein
MLNGDAHLSEIEGEQASASDPLPYFQRLDRKGDYHMGILVVD